MTERINVPNVGAPDPEQKNSPIFDRESDEFEWLDFELEIGVCYFNGVSTPLVNIFAAAMSYCAVRSGGFGYARVRVIRVKYACVSHRGWQRLQTWQTNGQVNNEGGLSCQ